MTGTKTKDTLILIAFIACFFSLLLFLVQPDNPVNAWFSDPGAALVFKLLFCAWVLAELANTYRSRQHAVPSDQDRGSFRIVMISHVGALFAIVLCRSFGIGTVPASLQYAGLAVMAFGVLLREWAVLVLGRHFTVRVQTRNDSRLVTAGPYRYIRHPSYTGTLSTLAGIGLAVGTWIGIVLVIVLSIPAYEYRIRVEEEALAQAFGPEYDAYRGRTGKLFPRW